MKKMVFCVILFMVFVMCATFLLITLYTPIKTSAAFDDQGYLFSESGTAEPCSVHLGGTYSSYRFDLNDPSFSSNALYSDQGLIINDRRYVGSFIVGWTNGGSNYATYISNGTRFYTSRDLEFVVAILPNRDNNQVIAVAPASSREEALELLDTLTSSDDFRSKSPSTCDRLRAFLK